MRQYDVFLSGGMTGYPEWNHPAFHEAAAAIRALGLTVWNPAEIDHGDTSKTRGYYMAVNFDALLRSKSLVSLPRWSSSAGAWMERKVMEQLERPVWNLAAFLKAYRV